MYHGDGGGVILRAQIRIEFPELAHQEHPLVDHRAAGEAHHIGVVVGLLEFAADEIQPPVKRETFRRACRPGDKALKDIRHTRARRLAQDLRAGRHLPPAEKGQALLAYDDLEHLLRLSAGKRLLGKEEHAHTVVSALRERDAARPGR